MHQLSVDYHIFLSSNHGERSMSPRSACKRPKVIKTLIGRAFREARLIVIQLKFNLF